MATKPARKIETVVEFNKVAVPAKAVTPNPFQHVIDYLNSHVDDADGAVEFNHDRPGYALGKIRSGSAEGVSFRAKIDGRTLTVWAQTRRPRVAKAAK
ncbi:hypothetical protein [Cellulosimicrobium sp. SL-1]|uniref:hypothetical protein n=1 Tax=Cellulosimicrobium sp. SL-1 TaxID=2699423 RepID=UPI0013D2F4C7|nr:hypothetical protein [Cellulosimicrobium sp. SL-1]